MKNISKENIKIISEHFSIEKMEIVDVLEDETTKKFLFKLYDGNIIEMANILFEFGYSGCASTQIGCNMGCKFCASGLTKKKRNLEVGEIVQQILISNKELIKKNLKQLKSTSFMGIGEPFDNYDNLVKAIKIINDPKGINLSMRSFTLSTCGLVNKIIAVATDLPQCNLAISLHATNDNLRTKLMPINKAYKIADLIAAAKKYISITNNDVTFQYTLIRDVNDYEEDAKELVKLLDPIKKNCHVTVIEFNQVEEFDFKSSKNTSVFVDYLKRNRISATQRLKRGNKIAAACGTMRINYTKKTKT
jgi:23S rRNA (adenine2503-C2)-methyltransferase